MRCWLAEASRYRLQQNYAHRFLSTGISRLGPFISGRRRNLIRASRGWKKYLVELGEGGVILKEQKIYQAEGWTHPVLEITTAVFSSKIGYRAFRDVIDTERRTEGLRKAKAALAGFLSKLGVRTPLPYYAILVADGDHMGKAIERQKGFKDHQRLSTCLAEFAKSVRSTVESGYAGSWSTRRGSTFSRSCRFIMPSLARGSSRIRQRAPDSRPTKTPDFRLVGGIGISYSSTPCTERSNSRGRPKSSPKKGGTRSRSSSTSGPVRPDEGLRRLGHAG